MEDGERVLTRFGRVFVGALEVIRDAASTNRSSIAVCVTGWLDPTDVVSLRSAGTSLETLCPMELIPDFTEQELKEASKQFTSRAGLSSEQREALVNAIYAQVGGHPLLALGALNDLVFENSLTGKGTNLGPRVEPWPTEPQAAVSSWLERAKRSDHALFRVRALMQEDLEHALERDVERGTKALALYWQMRSSTSDAATVRVLSDALREEALWLRNAGLVTLERAEKDSESKVPGWEVRLRSRWTTDTIDEAFLRRLLVLKDRPWLATAVELAASGEGAVPKSAEGWRASLRERTGRTAVEKELLALIDRRQRVRDRTVIAAVVASVAVVVVAVLVALNERQNHNLIIARYNNAIDANARSLDSWMTEVESVVGGAPSAPSAALIAVYSNLLRRGIAVGREQLETTRALSDDWRRLRGQSDADRAAVAAALQDASARQSALLAELDAETSRRLAITRDASANHRALRLQLADAAATVDSLNSTLGQTRETLAATESDLESAQDVLGNALSHVDAYGQQASALDADLQARAAQLAAALSRVEVLTGQLGDAEGNASAYELQLLDAQGNARVYELQLRDAQGNLDVYESRVRDLVRDLALCDARCPPPPTSNSGQSGSGSGGGSTGGSQPTQGTQSSGGTSSTSPTTSSSSNAAPQGGTTTNSRQKWGDTKDDRATCTRTEPRARRLELVSDARSALRPDGLACLGAHANAVRAQRDGVARTIRARRSCSAAPPSVLRCRTHFHRRPIRRHRCATACNAFAACHN
jgi:hypothetical protein